MPRSPDSPEEAIARYQVAYGRLRAATVARVLALWALHGGLSDEDADRFTAAAVPVVLGGQVAIARLVAGYLAIVTRTTLGTATAAAVDPRLVTAARGIAPAEVYRRPVVTARTAIAEGRPFAEAMRTAADRLERIADTDVALAQRQATVAAVAADDRIVGYRRVLTGSSCALCATASTQRYRTDQLMPIHGRCIPAGSVVVPPPSPSPLLGGGPSIIAVTRRWYAGEMVVLATAAGDEVPVTPNHPVLTTQGWLPAGFLSEGDDVLRRLRSQGAVGGRPDENERPALIEDVWRALLVKGRLVRVPLAAEDFHGDRAYGEVDVVWADGDLSDVGNVEPVSEQCLVAGHGSGGSLSGQGNPTLVLGREGLSPHGVVGSSHLGGALFGGHLAGSVQTGVAAPTRFDPPGEQFTLQSSAVYAQRGVDLVRRLAGQVEADRIVQLRQVSFSGHVYNLHTSEGWYSSNSHIVSNCDCGVAPIFGQSDPGQVINRRLVKDLRAAAKSTGAKDYATNRHVTVAEDGSVVLPKVATHQHGELGPTLTRAADDFTGPGDIAA